MTIYGQLFLGIWSVLLAVTSLGVHGAHASLSMAQSVPAALCGARSVVPHHLDEGSHSYDQPLRLRGDGVERPRYERIREGRVAGLSRPSVALFTDLIAPQTVLKTPSVGSTKLQNIVDDLYKGTTNAGRVGTGTTADALCYELSTGQRVFGKSHLQKTQDSLRGRENWLKVNPSAPYHDRLVARSLADDLLDALGQAP